MTVYILELEPIETRYTAQWADHIPKALEAEGLDVVRVAGNYDNCGNMPLTPGAFLNFAGTNAWKSDQLLQLSWMFSRGEIKDGDYFLYTDAWNPTVIQLKYMAELLGIKIGIGGMWHAGSYDPQDFLGRLIGNTPWVRHAEESMFNCFDHNFFATEFHINLFAKGVIRFSESEWTGRAIDCNNTIQRVGWPMEYMPNLLSKYKGLKKENIVLFPHRIAPEKQVDVFKNISQYFPEFDFVVCQEQNLSKDEYHELLGKAKVVFSANLQETLGISCFEGAAVGAIPIVPDRLSYTEMYDIEFRYPSKWSESFEDYKQHKEDFREYLAEYLYNYEAYIPAVEKQYQSLLKNFFDGREIYKTIKGYNNENNPSNGR